MDSALKDKWVAALRSGKYTQGTGRLRSPFDNGHCCLGVLADIVDPKGWKAEQIWRGNIDVLSLEERRPIGLHGRTANALMRMNDDRGWGFIEIADWIEENL